MLFLCDRIALPGNPIRLNHRLADQDYSAEGVAGFNDFVNW